MSEDDDLQETLSSLRDDVSDLNQKFSNYITISDKQARRRRVENLHTLTALGILGGFVTALSQGLISSSSYTLLLWLFAIASAGFLLGKIVTVTLQPVLEHRWLTTTDELVIPFLYMTSLVGVSLGLVGNIVLNRITVAFPQLPPEIVAGIIAVAVLLIATTVAGRYAIQYRRASRAQEERTQRVAGTSCQESRMVKSFNFQTYTINTPGKCRLNTRQESTQVVDISSQRGTSAHIVIRASSQKGEISILGEEVVQITVPKYSSSKQVALGIQQASESPSATYDTLELEMFFSPREVDGLDDPQLRELFTLTPTLTLTQ